MEDKVLYQRWRDQLLQSVGNICRECVDPRKEKHNIDYVNPLNGSCRCNDIDVTLSKAADIDEDIRRLSIAE